MFALSNRPFRNAGLALYGLGSLASLGLVSDQASAQTMASNGQQEKAAHLAAKCDHLHTKPPEHAGCYAQEALNFERARGVAAERRGAEADKRAAESQREASRLDVIRGCIDFLKENRGKSFTQDRMLQLAGGKVSEDNACTVARTLGYVGRKAAIEAPTTR